MQRNPIKLGTLHHEPFGFIPVPSLSLASRLACRGCYSVGPFAKWRADFDNITVVRASGAANDQQRDS